MSEHKTTGMGFRTRLLVKLMDFAENPQNEFDRIITENKSCLNTMDENQLCEMYTLRNDASRLCQIIPYSREDITSLIENNEVSPFNRVAELENYFLIAECIFTRLRGEEY